MPDITMCVGTGCPLREECYRYTAEPNPYRQSFADFTGWVDEFAECNHFTPNEAAEQ